MKLTFENFHKKSLLIKDIFYELISILFYAGSFLFLLFGFFKLFTFFKLLPLLHVVDEYLKIVLTAWPAVILILVSFLLIKQHGAIDEFIRKRITSVGLDGIQASSVSTTEATPNEIKAKIIEDTRESSPLFETSQIASAPKLPFSEIGEPIVKKVDVEENFIKETPKSRDQAVVERFEKTKAIEELAQTYFLAKYGEKYKPHIKLTMGKTSVVLDGLLMNERKNKYTAFEIKYFGNNKSSESLKYIVIRLRDKLRLFGIKKLKLIIIGENLSPEDCLAIQEQLTPLVVIDFFSLKNNNLEQIYIKTEIHFMNRDKEWGKDL